MDIKKLSAFTHHGKGGNPAGVMLLEKALDEQQMQRIAAEVGYSETAFAYGHDHDWRVRYFAPTMEVPFCGHATIALGYALGERHGVGEYKLSLNHTNITVEYFKDALGNGMVTLASPETHIRKANDEDISAIFHEFGIAEKDLDNAFEITIAHGGADHMVIGLNDRLRLSQIGYHFGRVKALMDKMGLITICFFYCESKERIHTRNMFASGGVYEDPATGAASAALIGYLRDIEWLSSNNVEIIQGEDMGRLSKIFANIPSLSVLDDDRSVSISGYVTPIA